MTQEIKWHTQEDGLLRGFSVHDGNISALSVSAGEVEMVAVATSGARFRFIFKETVDFNFAGFRHSAIVGRICVWQLPYAPKYLEGSDNPWKTLFSDLLTRPEDIARAVEALAPKTDHFIAHVDFSYGGAIAVVCKQLAVYAL